MAFDEVDNSDDRFGDRHYRLPRLRPGKPVPLTSLRPPPPDVTMLHCRSFLALIAEHGPQKGQGFRRRVASELSPAPNRPLGG